MLRNKALFSNFIENVIKNPSTDIQKKLYEYFISSCRDNKIYL